MKTVVIFTISLRGGGAERIISELLNEGKERFKLHLVLLENDIFYPVPSHPNVQVHVLGSASESRVSKAASLFFSAWKLRKLLRKLEVDTLLSVLNRPNIISCLTRILGWKGRLILSERVDTIAYYDSVRFGSTMLYLVRKLYNSADLIITISQGIALSLESLGIRNCLTIHNPVRLPAAEDHVEFQNDPDEFSFICVGRLESQKNYPLALKALAAMKESHARLVVLGKGDLESELKDLTKSLGLEDRVTWAGFQKNVGSFFRSSNALLLSSDYEGFGNVITEAMAHALPVVVSDCPHGPREIIAPDTDVLRKIRYGYEEALYGLLTPVNSVEGLASAMDRIVTDTNLRRKYAQKGPERAADFEVSVVAEKYFSQF